MHELLTRAIPGATQDVRFAQREIDVLAVPYNRPLPAWDPRHGRYLEAHAPGSFDGIERRANRVKVLRNHDLERPVGRAKAFNTREASGLLATLSVSKTAAGDETLALAEDGVLEVSIGFAAMPDGEQWNQDRSEVLRTRSFLGEISFVTFGQFRDAMTGDDGLLADGGGATAGVLAVRNGALVVFTADELELAAAQLHDSTSATPNKDRIRLLLMQSGYSLPANE